MEVPVLVAVTGPGEPELVRAIAATRSLAVARRCADVVELLAVAATGRGALAVVSASYLGIDKEVVAQLQRHGVRIVGIAATEDTGRIAALGCDAVVGDVAPEQIVTTLLALRERVMRENPIPPDLHNGEPEPHQEPIESQSEGVAGVVIAVWGTAGAPGRTMTAANLARFFASHGPTCLIDADTRAPSVAQVLGVIEDTSGAASAARAAVHGRLNAEGLDQIFRTVGGVHVLTGLTRPDRWRELPATALLSILDLCRHNFRWIVVDVAGGWDDEEEMFGPARDAARDTVLGACDVVITMGSADPVGVWRLVELLSIAPRTAARNIVVMSKARATVPGPSPRQAVSEALARFAGVSEPILIPHDQAAFDAALLRGAFLHDVARESPAVNAIAQLGAHIIGSNPPRARRRTENGRWIGFHRRARRESICNSALSAR